MKRKLKKSLKVVEVIKVVDLEPIVVNQDTGESYKFRIEILKENKPRGLYHARVWRRETFKLQPTFPIKENESEFWDKEILILDIARNWEKFKDKTAKGVLDRVLKEIQKTFNLA